MKVSVIIPVYNVAPYVERCLLSVLNQTWQDMEVLVVNDCTPDNSMEIVRRVVADHPRGTIVRILEHEVNRGLSAARNTGIRAATGDYLYFLDSDDYLPSDSIENLAGPAAQCHADFVIGNYKVTGSDYWAPPLRLSTGLYAGNEVILSAYLQDKWYVMAWNKLVRKDWLYDNRLFFEEGIVHEDDLWSFRLACRAERMYVVNAVSYYYDMQPQSIMRSPSMRNLECRVIVLCAIFDLITASPSLLSNRLAYIFFETLKAKYFDRILCHSSDETFRYECYHTFRAKKYLSARKALFRFRIGAGVALRNLHYALPVRAGYVYFKLYVRLTYYVSVLPVKLKRLGKKLFIN